MTKSILLGLSYFAVVLTTVGFLTQVNAATPESRQMLGTEFVTDDVTFQTGQSNLGDDAKSDLANTVRSIRENGRIINVTVAAWSDKNMPGKDEHLEKQDVVLAKDRAEQVRQELAELGVKRVRVVNMAKHSNFVAKLLKTRGAELKSSLAKKGTEIPVQEQDFAITQRGGPSRVVMTFEVLRSNH
jgi:hypothetical protein